MCSFYVELPIYVILNLNHAGRCAFEPSKREPTSSSLCTIILNPSSLKMKIDENSDNRHAHAVALPDA